MHALIASTQESIILLLFGQQTEPPRSLSRPKNSHVNRRKIKKIKITHNYNYDEISLKYPCV